jgi:hypothetical protein
VTLRTLALVCCLVLAGCSAPTPAYGETAVESPSADSPTEPEADRLGWENGYWYNDSIDVNQSDGLNESELAAFVARAMARVELIRGQEFEQTVPVEVVSRTEYRSSRSRDTTVDTARERSREQLWEAMLLVGEDRTVGAAFEELYGGAVLGYYAPGEDRIVLVSDDETPVVDRVTLAHELVHAIQDQQFSLLPGGKNQDNGLARTGVVEGDATYVEQRYEERCAANWSCVDRPNRTAGDSIDDRNSGAYLTIYAPYSEGASFVHRLHQRGGWDAVNELYRTPPGTTAQLLHPDRYPDDGPASLRVPDRSSSAWERYGGAQRVGESSLYAMFWFQRGVNRSTLSADTDPYERYEYVSGPTAGWAGDTLVSYRNGDADAYVWKLRWESVADARAFAQAYRGMITARLNATELRPGVYIIHEASPFGDAFRVRRDGTTVTIVNAPDVQALGEVHADRDD